MHLALQALVDCAPHLQCGLLHDLAIPTHKQPHREGQGLLVPCLGSLSSKCHDAVELVPARAYVHTGGAGEEHRDGRGGWREFRHAWPATAAVPFASGIAGVRGVTGSVMSVMGVVPWVVRMTALFSSVVSVAHASVDPSIAGDAYCSATSAEVCLLVELLRTHVHVWSAEELLILV